MTGDHDVTAGGATGAATGGSGRAETDGTHLTGGVHLADLDFWERPAEEQAEVFARLRAAERPAFFPPLRGVDWSAGEGFYALTRYEQVVEVSRNTSVFSSEPTVVSLDDPPPAVREFTGSMISMDDPRHARLRRIVSRAFTPRVIKKFEDDVAALASTIVSELIDGGPCDFVGAVAMRLPVEIICAMVGVPQAEQDTVIDATNRLIAALGDPGYVEPGGKNRATVLVETFGYLHSLMHELAALRRAHPADDLVTALVTAEVQGEALTDSELGKFFALLVTAGNETTRNAITHALVLLTEHEDQRAALMADLDGRLPTAVEEIVRYVTPVRWMRRNVTRDITFLGHTYRAGDRVVLYYNSANRDDAVFDDPQTFDVTRSPNPHVGFGAPGPHFCLGAHLARREITVLLRELLTRVPGIRASGPPVPVRSSFVNGISALPCTF